MRRFCATLDLSQDDKELGGAAPPGIHWCLSPEVTPTASLGPDGHPPRGNFLPPITLSRRMWAGGELEISRPLRGGDELLRTSRIENVVSKEGHSGPLCFVTVSHCLTCDSNVVLRETQEIAYRGLANSPADVLPGPRSEAEHPERSWEWTKSVEPHPTLLFRYSALTFNGHRIHYDRRYCLDEENYPGLVVHGPLQATLLLLFATEIRGGSVPRRFTFRSRAPLFDDQAFELCAGSSDAGLGMCTRSKSGKVAMQAMALW